MKRLSLIGRLGQNDNDTVDVVQTDSVKFELNLMEGNAFLGFGVGRAIKHLESIAVIPSEIAIDLVILACHVTAADTRFSRVECSQDGWTREIDLYIPVFDAHKWDPVRKPLAEILRFLTGDRWRLFFRSRYDAKLKFAPVNDDLLEPAYNQVSLFSGGLDSLIGAVDMLAEGAKTLFVSHYWDGETASAQSTLLSALQEKYENVDFASLRVHLGFDKNHLQTGMSESTQRGRSFLFYSLAALAASGLGSKTDVFIPENGLIALNVPLTPLRFGALSTRTAHPHFIYGLNCVLNELSLGVKLSNPYEFRTKGEMVRNCKDLNFLKQVIGQSMSCSSPAKARYKRLSPRHCGGCVPCLIRRAAIESGLGVGADDTEYTLDQLHGATVSSDRADGEHVRAFQLMTQRLSKSPKSASILIHKPGPLHTSAECLKKYTGVFTRGIAEVNALLSDVESKPRP
ncbi:Qat anti-phage system QueC-like protein QatC [Thalassospira sp. A3_1]|uniref:Qat anti-phage system QueC-like protein QatC n=1 Tax=Thalassospira sp. A3_1 TaxID=2821088 RepID=UPI001ADB87C7|nr:Qat anti-phage system QueC-like protein QatC [Thalassospira sp. A3_1]MBO9508789.1 hypothetical protein [Thalassospira sp. A3_1]